MSTVGVILSTVGDVQYRGDIKMHVGGYHEYRGRCSVPWGTQITKDFPPTVLTPSTVLMISPTCIMISPHGTQISKDGIPTVLNTPHGTHDIPLRAS